MNHQNDFEVNKRLKLEKKKGDVVNEARAGVRDISTLSWR